MLMHMKYEMKKSMLSKIIILAVTAVCEVAFLIGLFGEVQKSMQLGVIGLILCATMGVFYIGIESIITFHRDLNTKQSYMLFMTPYSSYTILGAKILENALAIFVAGAFFATLGALDITISIVHVDGLSSFLDSMQSLLNSFHIDIQIQPHEVILGIASVLMSWVMTIVMAYLAIALCATVLAGKKFSALVSFLIFLVLDYVAVRLISLIPEMSSTDLQLGIAVAIAGVITAIMYAVTGWIMERRLSV